MYIYLFGVRLQVEKWFCYLLCNQTSIINTMQKQYKYKVELKYNIKMSSP